MRCVAASGYLFEPVPESPASSRFDTHSFQVGGNEILDLAQVFQIATFMAGYVRNMTMPHTLARLLCAILDPDFHDERLCTRFD